MRWEGRRQSENVEDRRHMSAPAMVGAGLGGLGVVGVIIAIVIALLGGDPKPLLDLQQQAQQQAQQQGQAGGGGVEQPVDPAEERMAAMVRTVLADTEDVWEALFKQAGRTYQKPTLVLFRGQVQSACGFASAAMGPFYCPADQKVYIDLAFYDKLDQKFGAAGDFAQAYVLAHEVGHHVQKLLGITDRLHQQQGKISKEEYNDQSVRLELQADFFAGVWAHHAQQMKNILEKGDIQEAMNAAEAIGDDKLQMQSQGYIVPDSFTHGTSAQRERWFRKGLETGDMSQGDTFSARTL